MTGPEDRPCFGPVYVTKYALTAGIWVYPQGGRLSVFDTGTPKEHAYFIGERGQFMSAKDWTTDLAVAQARVKKMAARKVKSLEKQLVKYRDFVVVMTDRNAA